MSDHPTAPFCAVPNAVSAVKANGEADERILLGHGAGTRLTQQLLQKVFYPAFNNAALNAGTDSAVLAPVAGELAFTTDAYVVNPLIFPGGNIGTLAVCGTVNDLAMVGAMPVALSASFILEEGLPVAVLDQVAQTMAQTARTAGVAIVTGDTKVVERGKADGLFISTSGIGQCLWSHRIAPSSIVAGDYVVLSGDIGRHAVAIVAARQGFVTSPLIESDVACLHHNVRALHASGVVPHCMRDLTRGGLGAALLELANQSGLDCEINENCLPLKDGVKGVVDALGLDPWFLANEGRFIVVVPETAIETTLATLKTHANDTEPVVIGRFLNERHGNVIIRNDYGARRYLRMPLQEPLPRIC